VANLVRTVDQVQDYTNYSRGKYADYYQCVLPGSPFAYSASAETPVATTNLSGYVAIPRARHGVITRRTRIKSHELRVSTPDDWRLRAIAGLFWEDYKIHENADWLYKSADAGFSPIVPPTAPPRTTLLSGMPTMRSSTTSPVLQAEGRLHIRGLRPDFRRSSP